MNSRGPGAFAFCLTLTLALHGGVWLTLRGGSSGASPGAGVLSDTGTALFLVDAAVKPGPSNSRAPAEPALAPNARVPRAARQGAGLAPSSGNEADDIFVDARLLTLRPAPAGPVVLPAWEPRQRAGAAQLTIFVSAEGRVVRVRIDASDLPPEINDEVRQAFYRSSFRAGKIDEVAVNSTMRVEVVFELARAPNPEASESPPI